MTYREIVTYLETAAHNIPNVHTVVDEFTKLNREDTLYSAMVIQADQSSRTEYDNNPWMNFSFIIGYVDRLLEDKSNEVEIHSYAIDAINSVYSTFKRDFNQYLNGIDIYRTFTQRFLAECAGAYATITISVPANECEFVDTFETLNKTVLENGTYHWVPRGIAFKEVDITVNVPTAVNNQEKSITITNGGVQEVTYDQGTYTGMSKVTCTATVNANVDQNIQAGNIKNGVTILGVTGTFNGGDLQAKTVNPTISQQVITPDASKYGLSSVTVTGYSVDDIYNNLVDLQIGVPSPGPIVVPNGLGVGGSTDTSPWSDWDWSQKTNFNFCFAGVNLSSFPNIDMHACTSARYLFRGATISTTTTNKLNINLPNCLDIEGMLQDGADIDYIGTINIPKATNAQNLTTSSNSYLKTVDQIILGVPCNCSSMFQGGFGLTKIPNVTWNKITNAYHMFYYCNSMRTQEETPIDINLAICTNPSYMFQTCSNITKLGNISLPAANNIYGMFDGCSFLTTLGGLTNLGQGFTSNNNTFNLSSCSLLDHTSALNIFNTIYDMTQTQITGSTIRFNSATYSTLTPSEIAIATAKGWTITS